MIREQKHTPAHLVTRHAWRRNLLRSTAWVFALSMPACGGDAFHGDVDGLARHEAAIVEGSGAPADPPPIKIKLNDDLRALSEIVIPAVAESSNLDRLALPKQELFRATKATMKQSTGAAVDVLLDTVYSCHNDSPLVIELRNLVVEAPVSSNTIDLQVTGSGVDVDADFDALRVTGKLWLDWPKDESTRCKLTGHNYRVEVPFTVSGAELSADAGLEVSGGGLRIGALAIDRLALGSVDIDHDALNFGTDALILLADVIASAVQELSDLSIDRTPENGICNTPGSNADLDRCIETALTEHVVPVLEDELAAVVETALESATLPEVPVSFTGFSATFDADLARIGYKPQLDRLSFDVDATFSSTAATAACASRVTLPTPLAAGDGFDALGDLDVIVPYDQIQSFAYEVARQGVLCASIPGLPIALSLEPAGPVTIPAGGVGSLSDLTTSNPLSTPTTGSAGVTSLTTNNTGSGGSSGSSGFGVYENPNTNLDHDILMVDPDHLIVTRHPSRLAYPSTLGTGDIEVTVELGWLIDVDCEGRLHIDLVTASHDGGSGAITTRTRVFDSQNPTIQAQLDAVVASLPGRITKRPFGPSLTALDLLPGVYVSEVTLERSERELAIGFAISDRPSDACRPATDTTPPVGDDTPEFDTPDLVLSDDDRAPGGNDPHDPGTLGNEISDGSLSGR